MLINIFSTKKIKKTAKKKIKKNWWISDTNYDDDC